MRARDAAILCLALAAAGLSGGCVELPPDVAASVLNPTPSPAAGGGASSAAIDPVIANALSDLVENKEKYAVNLGGLADGSPLSDMLKLGSPAGYLLRIRHLDLGVPISEALARDPDPAFRDRLVTLTRWDRDPEVRAASLVTVAGLGQDIGQLAIYQEALIHLDPAVRFGAIEALGIWSRRDLAAPLLVAASEKDSEPVLRVQAAVSLARIGNPAGLTKLRAFLEDGSWLVRAMAARYIGDFGVGADYDLVFNRISRETSNDFVTAELCIAALKLFPRRGQ